MADNANEQDREQDDHSQAPVSRRSFVVGVAAAGAAATAGRALPGRRALPVAAGTGRARAAASTCGSLSLAKKPVSGGELTDAAFVSADEWWAVGNVGVALRANRTLIVQFDGSSWSAVASPESGHVEQRAEQGFHDRWRWVGGRLLPGHGVSAAGVAVGRDTVVAELARCLPQRLGVHRCGHPGGRDRVGGRFPDHEGRGPEHADRAGIGRDVDAGGQPQRRGQHR